MVDTIRVQYNQEALASYGLTMANAAEQVSKMCIRDSMKAFHFPC